jgi:hypothetical protein
MSRNLADQVPPELRRLAESIAGSSGNVDTMLSQLADGDVSEAMKLLKEHEENMKRIRRGGKK